MTNFIMQPWHLLLAILGGAVHDEQQQVIEYLRAENQVLRENPAFLRRFPRDRAQRRVLQPRPTRVFTMAKLD